MNPMGHFEPSLGELEPCSTWLSMGLVGLLEAVVRLLAAFLYSHRSRSTLRCRQHLPYSVSGETAIHQIPYPHDVTIVTKRRCFQVSNDIVITGVLGCMIYRFRCKHYKDFT